MSLALSGMLLGYGLLERLFIALLLDPGSLHKVIFVNVWFI